MLDEGLLVLRVVVLRVLGDVPELARDPDALGDLTTLFGREVVDLLLQLLVTLFGEDDFLRRPTALLERNTRRTRRRRGPEWYRQRPPLRKGACGYDFRSSWASICGLPGGSGRSR